MLFGSQGFSQTAQAIPPPFRDTGNAERDVGLLTLETKVGTDGCKNVAGLFTCGSPHPRGAPVRAYLSSVIHTAAELKQPLYQSPVCVSDLDSGRDVLDLSPCKANTTLSVNDASQVGSGDGINLHALIVSHCANKGTIKNVHRS